MSNNSQAPYQLLEYYSIESLNQIYNDNFKTSTTKGIDRLSGIQFAKQASVQIEVISNKCLQGTYRFSPYLELLRSKGRGKPPRVLAIPTIRDRIVLYALKDILSQVFIECVPRKLANTYIHEIKKFIEGKLPCEVSIIGADIKDFYGSIDREKLFIELSKKIDSHEILTLLKRAIETPIVPNNYHRKDKKTYISNSQNKGIPQGLSISNILASIYLQEFDNDIRNHNCADVYYRYVDDILIFTKKEKNTEVNTLIKERVEALKLELNDKTYTRGGEEYFEYLGYRFELPKVTIKSSAIEKFIRSVAAKFSSYIYRREKNNYGVEKLKEAFISRLNEKITGAISEERRYGWIFYFNAINDISVLYMIDNIIANFFKRLNDFERVPPPNLKKISRAFYEAKHTPKRGYIHNYNSYETVKQKREFLEERGLLEPNKKYSDEEISDLYENEKRKSLSELEKDDAILY
jgi:retron-type reverse transcriptase